MCEKCRTHRLQLRRVASYTPLMESVARSINSVTCLPCLTDLTEAAEPDDAVGSHGRAWPPAVKPCLPEPLRGVRWSDPSRPAAGERVTRRESIASHTVYHGFNAAEDDNCWLRARASADVHAL